MRKSFIKKTKKGKFYIGTSGWVYSDWQGVFYPEGLPAREKLRYFSQHFKTTEINYSFYHLPRPATYQNWSNQVPADFIFSLKASRFITHIKQLRGIKKAWKQFLNNALSLKEKLGPILFQFPPSFKADKENIKRLEDFLELICQKKLRDRPRQNLLQSTLPKPIKTTGGNPLLNLQGVAPCKFAFEFRDKSWCDKKIYDLLKKYNVAWVIADSPNYPKAEVVTADFVYLRMHGPKTLFASKYTQKELSSLSQKIKKWLKTADVYCYFNNDAYGYAIENAKELLRLCQK